MPRTFGGLFSGPPCPVSDPCITTARRLQLFEVVIEIADKLLLLRCGHEREGRQTPVRIADDAFQKHLEMFDQANNRGLIEKVCIVLNASDELLPDIRHHESEVEL